MSEVEHTVPRVEIVPRGGKGGCDLRMDGEVFPYHISIDEPVHYEKLMKDGFGKLTLTLFVEGFEDHRPLGRSPVLVTTEDSS